jgi:hypothetical protein
MTNLGNPKEGARGGTMGSPTPKLECGIHAETTERAA